MHVCVPTCLWVSTRVSPAMCSLLCIFRPARYPVWCIQCVSMWGRCPSALPTGVACQGVSTWPWLYTWPEWRNEADPWGEEQLFALSPLTFFHHFHQSRSLPNKTPLVRSHTMLHKIEGRLEWGPPKLQIPLGRNVIEACGPCGTPAF